MRVDTFGTPCQSRVVGGEFEVGELVTESIETDVLMDVLEVPPGVRRTSGGACYRALQYDGQELPLTLVGRASGALVL
ncbi:hypothetical protein AQI96_42065 [Streptomyces canus]|nr:hypothetical protein AQI96_42065 [Streptomyces canus]